MEYVKINVLVVTYKQADVIGRNIESILQQKDYGLHEIIICDDCSPDNNWEIIQTYVKKYPRIIRAYRNKTNLGIYANSDKLVTLKGDADLFCWLEGDDALCDGFFKNIQETIINKHINIRQKIGILCNWKTITPHGIERITYNKGCVNARLSPFSMYLRGIVTWRGSVFTSSVLDCFTPTKLDAGLQLAETLFDSQFFKYSEKLYYNDCIGSIYYSNIGISILLSKQSSYRKSEGVIKIEYLLKNLILDDIDTEWLNYLYYRAKMNIDPSFYNFKNAVYHYKKGVYTGPGCLENKFKRYIVPLITRLLRIK